MEIYIPITWLRWNGTNYPYRIHQPQLTVSAAIDVARHAMLHNYAPAPKHVSDFDAKSLDGMPCARRLVGHVSRTMTVEGAVIVSSIGMPEDNANE